MELAINIVHTDVGNYALQYNQDLLRKIAAIINNEGIFFDNICINILFNGSDAKMTKDYITTQLNDMIVHKDKIEPITGCVSADLLIPIFDHKTNQDHSYIRDVYIPHPKSKVRLVYYSCNDADMDKPLPLGAARDVLQSQVENYYINLDEDDDLVSISCLNQLLEAIPLLKNPIALFGFKWRYEKKDARGKNWCLCKDNPRNAKIWSNESQGEFGIPGTINITPVELSDYTGLCSWNILHSKECYEKFNLERPNINKYDDCFFYMKLTNVIQEVSFIQAMVYDYHQERGTMNVEKDDYLDTVTSYIDDKPFLVTQLITFPNEQQYEFRSLDK